MEITLEWKAQHAIDILPGSYFSSAMLADGSAIEESRGLDEFQLHGMVLPEKRVAGFGRTQSYRLEDLPAGLAVLEASPSQLIEFPPEAMPHIAFSLDTNVFLSQELLSHNLSLGIKKDGVYREIPLQSSAASVDWQGRGKYIVTIHDL